ncbi:MULTISPECIES: hypothetical protein [unclassified Synechococcus]|uniref:hypothetical protein n=1 Tax=unclassified Synechococcus TaxID=2626047 RepID=UPI0018CE6A12|nr:MULTISPECIES: hypothetical protein [unclassified Synechococcus]MEA5424369.1 hypothetical protein [Synechococcus sp. CCY9202]QPN59488.1 hypothetical protein H8F24_15970 [Synechococcus sp. CBW1002]QPN66276.1 hypothetical protein H8F26_16010 [Synechococcus sp. CBW1006]
MAGISLRAAAAFAAPQDAPRRAPPGSPLGKGCARRRCWLRGCDRPGVAAGAQRT